MVLMLISTAKASENRSKTLNILKKISKIDKLQI